MKNSTKLITELLIFVLVGIIIYGFWSYTKQVNENNNEVVYGRIEQEFTPVSISSLLSGENTINVTIEGKVVSMGPTMGCWMIIDDGTGEVMVQTSPMVYTPQEIRNKTIRATGSLTTLNGGMGFNGNTLALITSGVTVHDE
jgi:hypothetical protein